MRQWLNRRERGGFGATTTFEEYEQDEDAADEAGDRYDDYEGCAELDGHLFVRKESRLFAELVAVEAELSK